MTRPTDRTASLVVVFGFSVALGVGTVAIPLLALSTGYDAAAVGFLAAAAAASQLATRLALPRLLGRFDDRLLIAGSSLMMVTAFGILLSSTVIGVFLAAQVLQGAARAIFWTSSQTHAIRGHDRTVQRLVDLNMVGSAGTLVGPALGGSLAAIGLPFALTAAMVGAATAAAWSLGLRRFEPFDRHRSAGALRLLRREGVDLACWASVVGGGWWSMMGSFVPVLLVGAGVGPQGVGWLITASEAAGAAALLLLRNVRAARVAIAVRVGALVVLGALAALALAPADPVLYALLLLTGGAGSGTVTTLSAAMASLAAGQHEQGDALALSGTFRAAALFTSPAAVGALVSVIGLSGALLGLVAGLAAPGLLVLRRGARRPAGSPAGEAQTGRPPATGAGPG